ncbi:MULTISPECIES: hypothetical protein [unclassified Microbulbifer]|nr:MULTISPECIES: hypothetical protein [unclassified Microbulbifer]
MTAMDGGMPPSGNADFAGAKICQANCAGNNLPVAITGEGKGAFD